MIAHRDLDDLPNPRPHGDRPAQPALVPLVLAVCGLLVALPTDANDWAEWRGTDRVGIWSETGIVEQLPATLEVKWRVPLNSGYSGPAVADGRVFITDWAEDPESRTVDGTERAIALDEETGEILWVTEWPTSYRMLMFSYAVGPRATPTVDDDRVYVVGAPPATCSACRSRPARSSGRNTTSPTTAAMFQPLASRAPRSSTAIA